MLKTICNFISQYLGVIVLIVAVLAFLAEGCVHRMPRSVHSHALARLGTCPGVQP